MLYYSGLSRTLRQLRWVLYPRRCPFCDRVLGNQPACPDCADGLAELRRAPSMRLRGSEHYLGRLDGAAAPYRYTGLVRRAVLRAKYQGAPWAAVELGVEMARLLFGSEIRMCGSEPLPEPVPGLDRGYDCILPVPASSKKRGYNVPERMAQPLARAVGVPVVTDALTRARSTRRQEGLSLDERLANVAGAFRVARPEAVEGKRILLVDDVLTTGATASACAQALLDAGAQMLHYDVMDGHFVPNISFGVPVLKSLHKGMPAAFYDVHLMISHPLQYAEPFIKAGASLYNFHLECEDDIQQTIDAVKALGCKVGLTIKPGTAPEALAPYLDQLDLVLVMSVEPGFGGQKFMPSALDKLRWLKAEREARGAHYLLEVDGGVDNATAPQCVEAGADILVAGSAVFGAADPAAAVQHLASL